MKSSPRLPQLEKARAQQRRPNTAKKKKKKPQKTKKKTPQNYGVRLLGGSATYDPSDLGQVNFLLCVLVSLFVK